MDTVVMELEGNLENDSMNLSERKSKQPNVGMVKQETPEADDILLQLEVRTSKPENVSIDEQLESASFTFDADEMSNQSLEIKLETVAQDSDEELSVKEELLHDELDIKSEDETTQENYVDEKHNLGNKLPKQRKHPCRVKPFKCNICDQSYSNKGNLKTHLSIHTEDKPFQCNICDHSFGQKSNLKVHLRTHAGEKPFKCYICGYSCRQKCHLNAHLKTHTGEKPFKCNICDYSSSKNVNLKRHLITHTGEKPFKCHVCDHSCRKNDDLKVHLRTHTGEKPFKCNICDSNFNHKCNLIVHLRTHSGEKPFKCNFCDYRSTEKSSLIRHLRRSHMC